MSTITTNINEYDAIAKAIQPYLDGAKSGQRRRYETGLP